MSASVGRGTEPPTLDNTIRRLTTRVLSLISHYSTKNKNCGTRHATSTTSCRKYTSTSWNTAATIKKVLDHVEQRYFGIPRTYVQEFCRTCPTCQLRTPQTSRAPLKPIIESEFLSRVQVDLIDNLTCVTLLMGRTITCHFVDHFTKYHILFPLQDKTAESVSQCPQ